MAEMVDPAVTRAQTQYPAVGEPALAEPRLGHGTVHPKLVTEPGTPERRSEAERCRGNARCLGVGVHEGNVSKL